MGIVDASVGLMTFNVFVTILGCGDDEDDDDGENDEAGADSAELREELEDGDCGEETVDGSGGQYARVTLVD